jgi:hypothetical protein
MAKKIEKKEKISVAAEDAAAAPTPIWEHSWFPALLFLLLSLVYFSEFVLSDKVIFGSDIGTDFHKGKEPFVEKVKGFVQPAWTTEFGGRVLSDEMRFQYFPTQLISLFTTHQRHLGWRYILTAFLAGWGMYLYMRGLSINRWAAIWVGLAYMSAPTFLGFTISGQYAKMGVIALFPFMCLMLEKGMERGRLLYFVGLGCFIALGIFSPHIQMLYYALCALGLYFLYKMYVFYRQGNAGQFLLRRTLFFAIAVALGLGIGAEGVFPSYLYTKGESKRAAQADGEAGEEKQIAFAQSWSLHPEEVGSLIIPEFGGFDRYYWGRNAFKINSEYFGILVVLLALVAVPNVRQEPFVAFLCILFILVLAFSLGGHTPVHWLAYHLLPGGKVLRTIGMVAYLFAFPACVLAGLALHKILTAENDEREILRRRILITGGVLTGIALLTAVAPAGVTNIWISLFYSDIAQQKREVLAAGYAWLGRGSVLIALMTGGGTALLALRTRQKVSTGLLVLALGILVLFDGWRISRTFLRYEDPARHADIRHENPHIVRFLKDQGEMFRVLRLPEWTYYQQSGFHFDGAIAVSGRFDLTIKRYNDLMGEISKLTGMLAAKYLKGQKISYKDADLLERFQPLLRLLNVKYLIAPNALILNSAQYPEAFAADGFRLYENPDALPWCYLAPAHTVVEDEEQILALLSQGSVDPRRTVLLERAPPPALGAVPQGDIAADQVNLRDYDPDAGYVRIEVQSGGPRMLVYCENYHENWRPLLDGQETEMYRANYAWRAVFVPAGEHVVEFRYRSARVVFFRAVTLLSLGIALALGLWDYRRSPAVESSSAS